MGDLDRLAFVRDTTGMTSDSPRFQSGLAAWFKWVMIPESDPEDFEWEFLHHTEHMEVDFDWDNIQNGPVSTVTAIDQAVTNSHAHANKTSVLDYLGVDGYDNLTFKNNPIVGETFSRIFLQNTEPLNPNENDMWLEPITSE